MWSRLCRISLLAAIASADAASAQSVPMDHAREQPKSGEQTGQYKKYILWHARHDNDNHDAGYPQYLDEYMSTYKSFMDEEEIGRTDTSEKGAQSSDELLERVPARQLGGVALLVLALGAASALIASRPWSPRAFAIAAVDSKSE